MTTSKNNNLKNYNEYFDMFFLITSLPNKNTLVTSMSSCMCLILYFSCKFVFMFEGFLKYHLFIFLTIYIYVSYSYFVFVFSIINIIFKMPIFSILISVIEEYIYSIVFKCTLQKKINNNTSQGKKVLIIQPDTYIHLLTHT